MEERCVVCGEIIPEGRQVCWKCWNNGVTNNNVPCDYCNSIKISTPASPRRKYKYCPMCGRKRVEE